ncbi:hypothetical protein CEXT_793511 [Caerostris extrusa]|uniref:Uncharacterized protein n=1 Tax=Caerostris extrusa TaxID=172846 RepID=A0AAV4SSZ8_CAEEX|nr:hypothetical protein CEXT_793511 [Caerostris extrusa]
MFEAVNENGLWRKRHNFELYGLLNEADTKVFLKIGCMSDWSTSCLKFSFFISVPLLLKKKKEKKKKIFHPTLCFHQQIEPERERHCDAWGTNEVCRYIHRKAAKKKKKKPHQPGLGHKKLETKDLPDQDSKKVPFVSPVSAGSLKILCAGSPFLRVHYQIKGASSANVYLQPL